ncbi:MAG TPA: DNA repair protein RecO, partial [Candidatus Angelobacter sp.]|nr:DNA repair protein RecO [Candidatus Angelobacter sp.]
NGEPESARRQFMPARETEAIILKTFPLGEADRLVSFFGRTSGRIRGVAGGARRLKNRYGSSLELLSHVKIWYVEKETRDLVRIQQCELLESFHKAQADYGLSTGLAVVSEISERVLPEQEVAEPMFRLLLLTAREIERRAEWTLPLAYFAYWTLKLGGWLPPMDRCIVCGKKFGDAAAYQSALFDGLHCGDCRKPGMMPINVPGREFAGRFSGKLEGISVRAEEQAALREFRDAMLNWIELHTERKLFSREMLETN